MIGLLRYDSHEAVKIDADLERQLCAGNASVQQDWRAVWAGAEWLINLTGWNGKEDIFWDDKMLFEIL